MKNTPTHPFKCDTCVLAFKLKSELELHRMIHHEKSNFKCKYCDYTCTKNEEFRNHLKSHIKNSIISNRKPKENFQTNVQKDVLKDVQKDVQENVLTNVQKDGQKNVTTVPETKKPIRPTLKIKAFARIKEPPMGKKNLPALKKYYPFTPN